MDFIHFSVSKIKLKINQKEIRFNRIKISCLAPVAIIQVGSCCNQCRFAKYCKMFLPMLHFLWRKYGLANSCVHQDILMVITKGYKTSATNFSLILRRVNLVYGFSLKRYWCGNLLCVHQGNFNSKEFHPMFRKKSVMSSFWAPDSKPLPHNFLQKKTTNLYTAF